MCLSGDLALVVTVIEAATVTEAELRACMCLCDCSSFCSSCVCVSCCTQSWVLCVTSTRCFSVSLQNQGFDFHIGSIIPCALCLLGILDF